MKASKVIFGLTLILVGVFLWGRAADWFYFSFGELIQFLFPVGLIVLGIWMIVRRKRQEDRMRAEIHIHGAPPPPHTDPPPAAPDTSCNFTGEGTTAEAPDGSERRAQSAPHISQSPETGFGGGLKFHKAFGDMFVDCSGMNLANVQVSGGVGDIEIRLHGGRLVDGLNRLVVSGFVGDVRVYIPRDMPYLAHCSNFVGDVDIAGRTTSGFGNNVDSQSPDYDTAAAKLYIAANSFVGDVRLYVM